MNKFIKQHWYLFYDIKGSEKLETQFLPCLKHPSHNAKCITTSRFTLTILTQVVRIVIWLLFNFLGVGNEK
jgi:hypothetical protein